MCKAKTFTLSLVLSMLCTSLFAQPSGDKKTTVGLYSISYESRNHQSTAGLIASHVNEKLSCFNNIEVLDRSLFPTLSLAQKDQMSEESARAETVEQGRRKGAKKLITGKLSGVETSKDPETKSIRVTMILDISVVNVETGITEKSKLFVCEGKSKVGLKLPLPDKWDKIWGSNSGDGGKIPAFRNALVNLTPDLMQFLAHSLGTYDDVCAQDKEESAIEYEIVNQLDETSLLFSFVQEPKWKKGFTRLDLMMEEKVTTFSGEVLEARQKHLVTGKFRGLSGSYGIVEIPKKSDYDIEKIVDLIVNEKKTIVVMEKQSGIAK